MSVKTSKRLVTPQTLRRIIVFLSTVLHCTMMMMAIVHQTILVSNFCRAARRGKNNISHQVQGGVEGLFKKSGWQVL